MDILLLGVELDSGPDLCKVDVEALLFEDEDRHEVIAELEVVLVKLERLFVVVDVDDVETLHPLIQPSETSQNKGVEPHQPSLLQQPP